MNLEQFKNRVEEIFYEQFPNGKIHVSTGCLSSESIHIGSTVLDYINVTKHNDPMYTSFWLHDAINSETSEFKQKVSLERDQGSISINPPEDSFMAMESVKIKFRKRTGDIGDILVALEKYYTKAKDLLVEHESNIYNRKNYDDKYFQN